MLMMLKVYSREEYEYRYVEFGQKQHSSCDGQSVVESHQNLQPVRGFGRKLTMMKQTTPDPQFHNNRNQPNISPKYSNIIL